MNIKVGDWVKIVQDIALSSIDYPENLLPSEGHDLIMLTSDKDFKEGYFLWSGSYIFMEKIGEDEYREINNIVYWKYKGGRMTDEIEELVKVAEAMGYINPVKFQGEVYLRDTSMMFGEHLRAFNPIENPEQDRELEIKFNIETTKFSDTEWQTEIFSKRSVFYARGKTPSEARLNCVIKYLEAKKNAG